MSDAVFIRREILQFEGTGFTTGQEFCIGVAGHSAQLYGELTTSSKQGNVRSNAHFISLWLT